MRFIELAHTIGSWSRDPSTKCGAVLVRPNRSVASMGFNGFPKEMDDDPRLYEIRDMKYDRVVHAEMNALMFCRDPVPLYGYSLYTTAPCCSRCAIHMIQAGIRKFIWPRATPEQQTRWGLDRTYGYLKEVDAVMIEVDP
jgi:dCMP deaminase